MWIGFRTAVIALGGMFTRVTRECTRGRGAVRQTRPDAVTSSNYLIVFVSHCDRGGGVHNNEA